MNRLFVSLYVDEDVGETVSSIVRANGLVVLTTQEAGKQTSTDEEQLVFATSREMAILTHNRDDFRKLAERWWEEGRQHCGVIIAIRRPPRDVARRVVTLLDEVSADEMDNQVYHI